MSLGLVIERIWVLLSRKKAHHSSRHSQLESLAEVGQSGDPIQIVEAKVKTYSEVLALVTQRSDGQLRQLGKNVYKVHCTASANLLLELKRDGNKSSDCCLKCGRTGHKIASCGTRGQMLPMHPCQESPPISALRAAEDVIWVPSRESEDYLSWS